MEMETYVSAVSVNMSNTHTDDSLNSVNHCVAYVSAVSVHMSNTHTDDSLSSVNHCATLSASMGIVLVTMYCCCGIDQ